MEVAVRFLRFFRLRSCRFRILSPASCFFFFSNFGDGENLRSACSTGGGGVRGGCKWRFSTKRPGQRKIGVSANRSSANKSFRFDANSEVASAKLPATNHRLRVIFSTRSRFIAERLFGMRYICIYNIFILQ